MGDAAAKDGILRIVFIEVDRIPVGGHFGEKFNIPVSDNLTDRPCHADFDVFDADRAAWCVVQHFIPAE